MNPAWSYVALLVVQALHLLHHRLAKRHISFVEVVAGGVLCIPPTSELLPGLLLSGVHLVLIGIEIVGSIGIGRLSPDWSAPRSSAEARS
jgi:hypothetical protein